MRTWSVTCLCGVPCDKPARENPSLSHFPREVNRQLLAEENCPDCSGANSRSSAPNVKSMSARNAVSFRPRTVASDITRRGQASLLAHVLTAYAPLNRQSEIYARQGVEMMFGAG